MNAARKRVLIFIAKLQSLVANCCKIEYSPAKFKHITRKFWALFRTIIQKYHKVLKLRKAVPEIKIWRRAGVLYLVSK